MEAYGSEVQGKPSHSESQPGMHRRLTARISFDEVSFVVDIHYSGDLLRLPANRPHSDEDLLEEQPMARGLSGFLAEVHPDQMRSWVENERCHLQLVFEL
jgi:hypothetical protein